MNLYGWGKNNGEFNLFSNNVQRFRSDEFRKIFLISVGYEIMEINDEGNLRFVYSEFQESQRAACDSIHRVAECEIREIDVWKLYINYKITLIEGSTGNINSREELRGTLWSFWKTNHGKRETIFEILLVGFYRNEIIIQANLAGDLGTNKNLSKHSISISPSFLLLFSSSLIK